MNFLFAWRYFNAKKSTNAINIIAWISVVAMGTGTAALIILMSVFNGFEDLVKSLYSDFYTDLRVIPASGKVLSLSNDQKQKIASWPGVGAVSLTVEEKAQLQNGGYTAQAFVKGVDENYRKVNNIAARLIKGKFLLGNDDHPVAILGVGIENALGTESDRAISPLTIFLPRRVINTANADHRELVADADPMQSLSTDNIATSGSFAIQQDFDNSYVITNIDFVKRMLGLGPNEYGAAEITLTNKEDGINVKNGLQQMLGKNYTVQTIYEQNQSLYATMRREKWFIFVLLSFILVVAAFTMVGALTMLVLEKQKDIQIIKAMGGSNGLVQKIFLSEGLLLAFIGGFGGVLLALIIGWAQVTFKLIKLQGNTFLIDHYPVKFLPTDVVLVFFTVVFIAVVASWFPSRKAAVQAIALKSS